MSGKSLLAVSVCRQCVRSFGSSAGLTSSRYLNPETGSKRAARVVSVVDQRVESELKRIEKEKLRQKRRNALLSFYKKSAVVNKNFKRDLAQVLVDVPGLRGLGMVLTKTQVDVGFSTLKVYWSCNTADKESLVSAVLTEQEQEIKALVARRIGEIPNLEFHLDIGYMRGAAMDQLFDQIRDQIQQEEDVVENIQELRLETDVVGEFNRDTMLKIIDISKQKSRAEHRRDPAQEKEFKENYLQSVENNGGEKKKETMRKIKKFLAERNKVEN